MNRVPGRRRSSFTGAWIRAALVVASLTASASAAGALEVDFEVASDLNGFLRRNEFQWLPINWTSSGGVGNSPALLVSRPHDTTYNAATFEMTEVGSKLAVSAFFKTSNFGPTGPGSAISFGEVYLSKEPEGWNSAVASVSVDQTSLGVRLWGGPIPAGGGSFPGFSPQFGQGLILPNRWYELNVEYEKLAGFQIGWDIEVNDYGDDGLNFVATTISSTQVTPDTQSFTSDATLYAGFTASTSGTAYVDNFFAGPPAPPDGVVTVSLTPSVDVELTPGSVFTLREGATTLTIDGGSGASFPVKEALLEFPLDQIPEGASIVSATLALDGISGGGSVEIVVDGYAGDGLAATADVSAATTELAVSAPYTSSSNISINLDEAYIESLLGSASHLGLRLSSLDAGPYLNIASLESTAGTAPTLSIVYEDPSLPGDFNGDEAVDGGDFLIWQRGGSRMAMSGGDLADWSTNFGTGGASEASTAAVPEPEALALGALAGLVGCAGWRRGRSEGACARRSPRTRGA